MYNVRLPQKDGLWQIGIRDGRFFDISPMTGSIPPADGMDAEGGTAFPPFIEPHIHLDTILTAGEPEWNMSGTLFEGIETWALRKKDLTMGDVKQRATKALRWQAAQGIQFVRTHVDVNDPNLTALKAMLEVKEEISPYLELQIVAFPQMGVLTSPNGKDLLKEAVLMGADVVGGIPHYELTREDGVASLKYIFELAARHGKLIDIHCDEIDDEQSRFVETVAAEAYRTGLGERVTASHTTAMHSYNNAYTAKLFRLLKLSKINFVANPLVNIHLQGRFDSYPKRRGLTRVKELIDHHINICFGHDDICDPWYPLGTGNMLQVLFMGIHVGQLMGYEQINDAMKLITWNSAKTLQIEENYGIEPGKPANLIILPATDGYDAIRRQVPIRWSIRKGKIIAETKPAQSTLVTNNERVSVDFRL
ncbi:cytosine deaminase [Sporolactobacillus sp. THM7-4]|nr:cytosine deaminase [Sporolactobacillus sp. THM7-4]